MKTKIPFLLITMISIFQSCSQVVPKAVDDAFHDKFLGAEDIVWDEGPDHDWMATFYMKKFHYMTAYYTPKGKFEAFEIEIYADDIPEELADRVFLKYPNATIYNVFEKNKVEGATDYIFEIENNGQLFGVYFRADGNFKNIPPDDYRFISRIQIENN